MNRARARDLPVSRRGLLQYRMSAAAGGTRLDGRNASMNALEELSTTEIISRVQAVAVADPTQEADERWALIQELYRRGDEETFRAAAEWCRAEDLLLRCLAADVLGQLGYEKSYPFREPSEPLLMTTSSTVTSSCMSRL